LTSSHEEELERALTQLHLSEGFVIRIWQEQDFPAIQRLSEAEGWLTPIKRPEETLAAWRNSWPALVAIADHSFVGFVRAWSDMHVTTYIVELLIDTQWRGRGIGSALLDACHALYPYARMEVASTEQSTSFYRQYGFREIGRIHRKSFI
jgi:ribosomal protein S18 acetylase RimI-like enzyme